MNSHNVVIIPGDGIGPEVTRAVRRILAAAEAPIEWEEHQAGVAALKEGKEVLPASTLEAIRTRGVALKGPHHAGGRRVLVCQRTASQRPQSLCRGTSGTQRQRD